MLFEHIRKNARPERGRVLRRRSKLHRLDSNCAGRAGLQNLCTDFGLSLLRHSLGLICLIGACILCLFVDEVDWPEGAENAVLRIFGAEEEAGGEAGC